MRKFVISLVSSIILLVAGKILDHIFPAMLPAVLAVAGRPVPIWTLALTVSVTGVLGFKLWEATSTDRKRKGFLSAIAAARNSYAPDEAERSLLQVFAQASGEIANFQVQNDLQRIADYFGVARMELRHGLESLQSIGWLERQITGYLPEVATLTLSREAITYCKKMGWWVATADRAVTADP